MQDEMLKQQHQIERRELNLMNQNMKKTTTAVRSYSHGLSQDEPLILEEIIKQCFSNPERYSYPNFAKERGWENSIYKLKDNPEYWINVLMPELIEQFNNAKIRLHDLDKINDKAGINAYEFLDTISRSQWCGPYKYDKKDNFFFLSIAQDGKNEYFVSLSIYPKKVSYQKIYFQFWKNDYFIAKNYEFSV